MFYSRIIVTMASNSSPMQELNNFCMQAGNAPEYTFNSRTVQATNTVMWTCSVVVPGFEEFECKSTNKNKKDAQQKAAAEFLQILEDSGHPGVSNGKATTAAGAGGNNSTNNNSNNNNNYQGTKRKSMGQGDAAGPPAKKVGMTVGNSASPKQQVAPVINNSRYFLYYNFAIGYFAVPKEYFAIHKRIEKERNRK